MQEHLNGAGERLRGRLRITPAMVVACLALFVALGGTSFAMATLMPVNSVGSAQLKSSSVTSSKVKNGSLLAMDFAAGQLKAGPRGPAGTQGAAGPVGPQGPAGPAGVAGSIAGTAGGDLTGSFPNATIADGKVVTSKLSDLSVSTAKLADSAVSGAKIADGGVQTADLADGSVTSAKVADGAVVNAKLADGSVSTAKLADLGVSTGKLVDSSVTTPKLNGQAVSTAKLADGAVTSAKLGSLPSLGVHNVASESIAISTLTALTFDTEDYDTDTMHSTSSQQSRLVATTAGVYLVCASVTWASGTGDRLIQLKADGTTVLASSEIGSGNTFGDDSSVCTVTKLAATHYVEAFVEQNAIGPLNAIFPMASMTWLNSGT